LIPTLGAEGAAFLQRQMTEHIIKEGQQASCDLLLCLNGGRPDTIESWLGSELDYITQQGDDLGDRMLYGFQDGFARGYQNIVLVGADCPTIDSSLLDEGFAALASHNLVLGPTVDGGYYLIGLNEMYPSLFAGIDWGMNQVLAQTMAIGHDLNPELLVTLHDVDSPEDLMALPSFLHKQQF